VASFALIGAFQILRFRGNYAIVPRSFKT